MPDVTHTLRMRERRQVKSRQSPLVKFALGCSGLFTLFIASISIFLALEYASITHELPPAEKLPLLVDYPEGLYLQPTRFYDRTGQQLILELQNPATRDREYLYYPGSQPINSSAGDPSFLPSSLISATVAAIDPTFFAHPGISLTGIWQDEHPTIAQQLASTFLLQGEPASLKRAIRERLLAVQITTHFGRPKLIEWYLNNMHFGQMVFGVDAASRLYLGKPASELSLAEAAILAAVAADPSLNPLDAPQLALDRQRLIIKDLLRLRLVNPEQAIQAARQELAFSGLNQQEQIPLIGKLDYQIAPAFLHLALNQLTTRFPIEVLERGGLRITTSLDVDLQRQIECASQIQLLRLQTSNTMPAVEPDTDCPTARLLPSLPFKPELSTENLKSEAIVMDTARGEILALYTQSPGELLEAPLPAHPAGSLSTLFIYTTAFTRGFSPASLVWDIPPENEENSADNFEDQYHGPVRLRIAQANDYLTPARQILNQVGTENVLRTATQLGIPNPENNPSETLNVLSLIRPVNLLEISHALSIFPNQGVLVGRALESAADSASALPRANPDLPAIHPVTILRVEDAKGQILLDLSQPQSRPILTPELAYLITNVLSDETARWPALGHPNPLEIGRPAAAKISSTSGGESNWVIGYTPQRIIGVWLGHPDENTSLPAGASAPIRLASAGLWHALMQYTNRYLPFQTFNAPAGISTMQVCDPSGLLPTAACPNVVDEVFLPGNEPVQIDTLYHLVSINRETGRLATIFSAPEPVEQRAYISVPVEAAVWAKKAGLETPPDLYDILPSQLPASEDARISSPALFSTLRGKVTISGTVRGDDLAFYRLQYGQGLNPGLWYPISEDEQTSIEQGELASWDTSSLDGLYTVQLLLVHQDKRAERSTILVTVDNTSPLVEIVSPTAHEIIQLSSRPSIVLQADMSDNLGVKSANFWIDGRLIATLTQPPYAISWNSLSGEHTLRVTAVDEACNTAEDQIVFEVE